MVLLFVTTNRHKFEQARLIFDRHGIAIEHAPMEYDEPKELGIEEVAKHAAKMFADKLKQPVFVDDTSFELAAYPGFPGPHPKFVITTIGFEGIFRLLANMEGPRRAALFTSAIGYCEPGSEPMVFVGTLKGAVTDKVYCEEMDVMPYQKIFIPEGEKRPMCMMTEEEKSKIGHRFRAFQKLIDYLQQKERGQAYP